MRRLALLLRCLALVALALLPACTPTSSSTPGSTSPQPAAQRPPSPVSLTLWHSWYGPKLHALNSVARAYERAHPDVRIRLEAQPAAEILRRYNTNVADGSAPQLLLTHGRYVGELAQQQYVAPLDAAFDTAALTDVLPQALEGARFDGQLYGLPIAFDTLVFFYDRRHVANPPSTFDEALELNAAERNAAPEQRPFSVAYYLMLETTLPFLDAFGGTVLTPEGQPAFATTSQEASVRWLQWLQELPRNENIIASANYSVVDAAIQSGRAWSAIDWSNRRANYAQLWGAAEVGVAPLPALTSGQEPRPLILSQVICVNTVTSPEQRAAAQSFLRFVVERSSQSMLAERGGLLPVHRLAAQGTEAERFVSVVASSQALPSGITDSDLWVPLNDMFRAVVSGGTTPTEALSTAASALPSSAP